MSIRTILPEVTTIPTPAYLGGLVNGHLRNIRRVDYLMVDCRFCHFQCKDCYMNN